MSQILGAVATATLGLVVSLGGVLAEATTSSGFAPWAQVGGTATAVGALAYVAKLLADGRLVAHPVAALTQAAERRETELKELIQLAHQREDSLRALLIGRSHGPT